MTENMEQFLFEMANKLGTTVEHLWQVMVTQAYIYATMGSIILFIGVSIVIGGGIAIYRKTKALDKEAEKSGRDPDYDNVAVWFFVWLGYTGFTIIVGIIGVVDIVTMFLNPEYWALKQILP